MAKQRILVTGGMGLIGHNVVQRLQNQGHYVVVVDNLTNYGIVPQDEMAYLMTERSNKIRMENIFQIDIADQEMIKTVMDMGTFDTVIHLASFPRQKVVNANPMLGSRSMSEGLLNLLENSVRTGVKRFVYISSSMVYGDFKNGVTEDAECDPIGQYGVMKLAGEWLVKDYTRRTDMEHVIIRPSAVYGPLDVNDRVISKFLIAAMRGETITVNGAKETLDFTHVDDVADGIVAAATVKKAANKTYNLTHGKSHTLLAAAKLAVKLAGQGDIKVADRDKNFPSRGALNITRAQKDLGFKPKIDIEEGFENYYRWLKDSVYWSPKTVQQPKKPNTRRKR